MIKAVIFDLDGTLLNTIEDITEALNFSLMRNGLPKVSSDEVKYFVGSGMEKIVERGMKGRLEKYQECLSDYKQFYSAKCRVYTKPYTGIVKVLKDLKRLGLKLAVFSNKPHNDTLSVVDYYFNGLFDYVLGKKDCNAIKPSTDGINEIFKELNIDSSNTIYIGDSEIDILTAKNANLPIISCLWGFRKKEELDGASYYISNTSDITKVIATINNTYLDGAIIYNKESGITSQDALINIRNVLTSKGYYIDKIGHCGTLDPLASGLLIVLINASTRLADLMITKDKVYETKIKLGVLTDSLDVDGNVINQKEVNVTEERIDEVLSSFIGKQAQTPPMYSAIKVNGKKLYEYARENKSVEVKARDIEIYSIERTSKLIDDEFTIKCHVSKGTYIRSLVRDIGDSLGTFATVKELNRLKTASFSLDDSYTINDIEDDKFKIIKPIDLIDFDKVNIDSAIYARVKNGNPIFLNKCKADRVCLIYDGVMVAIYERNDDSFKAKIVWNK